MAILLRQAGRSFVVLFSCTVSYGEDSPIYDKRMKETAQRSLLTLLSESPLAFL